MPKVKIWKRAQKIIQECEQGKRLCRLNRQMETGETEVVYFMEPGGKQVGNKSAENAIASQKLSSGNDGLFGNDFSQTWGIG